MNSLDYRNQIETDVLAAMGRPGLKYLAAMGFCALLVLGLLACWGYQIFTGLGVAGITHPVGWGVYITNFVFWVGIAHSGTLISAVLYLFRQPFRSSFNRAAEAMTVVSLLVAGLFPLIHLGRVWNFYYLFPYPNQRLLWVNFKSPLIWDVFAVSTYLTVSCIFFYVGLLPDLAIVRRRATGFTQKVFNILSLGWQGTLRQWKHYNKLYLFLAAFATPLVASVHSIVSWDFAVSIVPGWHTTIFAPYFVAGAIFSGIGMVLTLMIPLRKALKLEQYITLDHFDSICKILLFTSLIIGFTYAFEFALAFYSGHKSEISQYLYRATGHYWPFYAIMVFCNGIFPLVLFKKSLRRNLKFLFVLSIFVNIGMWFERFVIIVASLAKEYQPYSWGTYTPSWVEMGITAGSFGLFFLVYLAFIKALPVLSMTELKEPHQ